MTDPSRTDKGRAAFVPTFAGRWAAVDFDAVGIAKDGLAVFQPDFFRARVIRIGTPLGDI